MFRFSIALAVFVVALPLHAETCSVAGTAYDSAGKPLRDAVVRLYNQQTGHASYGLTDANAGYRITADDAGGAYRVDLLSHPAVVTGTHIPTRSILGRSAAFACRSGTTEPEDVRALAD